jgi:hypothetical protein
VLTVPADPSGYAQLVELDRPARPARRGGAKSDEIDAVRAARDALARTQLAQPRSGPERAALQMLLTVRRGAITAATDAQRQLNAHEQAEIRRCLKRYIARQLFRQLENPPSRA